MSENRVKKLVFVSVVSLGALTLLSASATATGPESDPETQDKKCGAVVVDVAKEAGKQAGKEAKKNASGLFGKYRTMRQACAPFRACKKDCRKSKRACKSSARGDKKSCKAECRKLRGKAKRKCKRACRKEFRGDKKQCRNEKRSCKTVCANEFKTVACKNGRKKFWGAVGNIFKKAGKAALKQKGGELNAACNPLYGG